MKDPFRPAERDTDCPKCGESHGWNKEDGLAGQICLCDYTFTGRERNRRERKEAAVNYRDVALDIARKIEKDRQDSIAQKMDKLLLVCEAARADGWEIAATGETIAPERGCCCPLGALALAAGFDPQNEDLLNPPGVQAGRILDEGNEFRDDFMRGFDGPEYAEAAGLPQSDDPLAYAYGKAFRGLYATQ